MTLDELEAWLELYDWANEPDEGDGGTAALSASAAERAFFHL